MDILSKYHGFESFFIMAGSDFKLDTYQSMVRCHVTEHATEVVSIVPTILLLFQRANELVKFTGKSCTTLSEYKMFFLHAIW